jgi:hypothetical protein
MSQDRHSRRSTVQHGKGSPASRGAGTRVLVGLLALAALVTGVGPWTPSAQAQSFGWAYLWAEQPTAPSYTPAPGYQFNSSGATNTLVRTGVGAYTALLPNLGTAAGTVHVTAYGTGSEACKVASWGPSSVASVDPSRSTQQVNVTSWLPVAPPSRSTCGALPALGRRWIPASP